MAARLADFFLTTTFSTSQSELLPASVEAFEEAAEAEELSLGQKLTKENAEAEVELVAALDKKVREAAVGHWLTDAGPGEHWSILGPLN